MRKTPLSVDGRITVEAIFDAFEYDRSTGRLFRKVRKGGAVELYPTSSVPNKPGYLRVSMGSQVRLLQHRVIWCLVYGYLPENDIDHIDRDKTNNKIENLREVSTSCNIRNSPVRSDNTSSVKGVCLFRRTSKWAVTIADKHLGYFSDFTEAVAHRLAAEQCLGWEGCDSTSSALIHMRSRIAV